MYCEYCGNRLGDAHKFCTQCGTPNTSYENVKVRAIQAFDQKWWFRLAKVVYIALYLPLIGIIALIWDESSHWNAYSNSYQESYDEAFGYSILAITIYVIIARLVKIAFLYIAFAQKPQWKKEFKKIF